MIRKSTAPFAAIACLLAAPLLAAEAPALIITKAGYYVAVTNDAGEPAFVKISQVLDMTGGVVTPPGGDGTPNPPADTLATQVRAWAAEAADPTGQRVLATIYKAVGENVRDGKLKPEDAFAAVKEATDQALSMPGVNSAAKWVSFRTKLGTEITRRLQAGELVHANQYAKFLLDVASALEVGAAEEAAIDPVLLQIIVQLILTIINRFIGGGLVPTESPV